MKGKPTMLRWLNPGDLLAGAVGLDAGSDNRLIFRMFMNTLVFGGVGVVAILFLS